MPAQPDLSTPPFATGASPLVVEWSFLFDYVGGVDTVEQRALVKFMLTMTWHDPRVIGLKGELDNAWAPEPRVLNSLGDMQRTWGLAKVFDSEVGSR